MTASMILLASIIVCITISIGVYRINARLREIAEALKNVKGNGIREVKFVDAKPEPPYNKRGRYGKPNHNPRKKWKDHA